MKTYTNNLSHLIGNQHSNVELSEQLLVQEIIQNSERVISKLYNDNFIKVKKMVWAFKNLALDPDDIFQEGFTKAIFNIQEGKFRGESSFSTYLNSICRNLCLKQLSKVNNVELNESHDIPDETQDIEMLKRLIEMKNQMGEKCRQVIELRFTLGEVIHVEEPNKCLSFDTIAERLNITTVSARQRFKRCLDHLREMIVNSPHYKEHFL